MALASTANRADGATCPASGYETHAANRDAAMLEAGVLATQAAGRGQGATYGDARAVYLWVLARYPDDAEALFGLSRIDAWEGCWALAENEARRALAAHPRDADVRAELVDLFTWQGRYEDAERLLEAGLAIDPRSPALLARRARYAYFRGDADQAIALLDEARAAAPSDGDLTEMRERFFVWEARAAVHLDRYPDPYQDIAWASAQLLRRIRRFELYGGAQLLQRAGGDAARVLDARFPLGVVAHPGIGAAVGAEVTPGAPATAIPDVAARAWALAPLAPRFSAYLGYAFWHFPGGATVHIFQPSVGLTLPFDLHVDARAWISALNLPATGDDTKPGQSKLAAAVGPALEWAASPRVTFNATYTYGAELDQNPVRYQLLTFRTHAGTLGADVHPEVSARWGLRPLVGVSRRASPTSGEAIWIGAFELGAYVRW